MNVRAENMTISNIFKKGKFIIPDYQREYDWNKENLNEFFDDINELEKNEHYFIGHMVCEGDFNGNEFKVIDGQQRITTITIMLCTIRDIFYKIEKMNLAQGIHENYIFSKDKDYKEYVILENKMPYPVLQKYVQNTPDKKDTLLKPVKSGEKKIIEAYKDFLDRIQTWTEDELIVLRDKLLNLEIIFVAVSDEVDAFTIFETLNAKGKDLTPMDLIKNQIFKNHPKQCHVNEPFDSWTTIIANTKESTLKFLNNFWASRYKKVSDRKIYKNFIEKTKTDFNYESFIKDLLKDSELFKKMTLPKKEDWSSQQGEFDIFLSLRSIRDFSVSVANSMILSVLREYEAKTISKEYCKKALSAIEKFHFINNAICSLRSSGLDTMYSRYAKDLHQAKDKQAKHIILDSFIKVLKEKQPKKEIFESKFDEKLYYTRNDEKNKKLIQYVLFKIEYKEQNKNIDLLNFSIEHIYPENPNGKWNPIDQKLISNIGNLVLLDSSLNSNIGNDNYSSKKEKVIEKSTLVSTKNVFSKNEKWAEENITDRRNMLVDTLYENIWE